MPMLSLTLVTPATALTVEDAFGGADTGGVDAIGTAVGLEGTDPRTIAANVINVVLGFLGIIAVVLIIYAGFLWMTAAGNDDKVTTAKSLMTAAVIGLVIILAAFGIAQFVLTSLIGATTA